MKILAIIPARGGSKGIPGKNLMSLGNKTLMRWATDCAMASRYKPDIVVDSEDDAILQLATSCGVDIHKRRDALSADASLVIDALLEAYNDVVANTGLVYDVVVLLQLTSPFRTTEELDAVLDMFGNADVDNVISVISIEDIHPGRLYRITDGKMIALDPAKETSPRQDLEPVYIRNGCFYAIRPSIMLAKKAIITKNKHAFTMDAKWWVNLDTPIDLAWANFLLPYWERKD